MSLEKLFGVLVVGGSLLAVAGCSGDEDRDEGRDPVLGAPDAGAAPADAAPVGADGGALQPCFCDREACCERDEGGQGTLQPGFECCWATTC